MINFEYGKRYLVLKDGSSEIREWIVEETSKIAVKVKNLVEVEGRGYLLFKEPMDPFWVLLKDIDTIGQAKYQIIEELR